MSSNQTTFKRRNPKQEQEFARNYNKNNKNDTPLYSLNTVNALDWKLFMWFASLETVENYVCLFIVVWDAIPVRNNVKFSGELREETNNLIQILKKLNISRGNDKDYSKILDDYQNFRFLNNQSLRQNLVHDVWVELENHGLKNNSYSVSNQLERCSFFQKRELRAMILSRIKSFQSFSRKIKVGKELQQAPLNDKMNDHSRKMREVEEIKELQQQAPLNDKTNGEDLEILLKENENLKDQINNLSEKNPQIINPLILEDNINGKKQLIDDITDLQDILSDFTMVQGGDYKIIDEPASSLLKTRKCKVDYPSAKSNVVLGALLQHLVIETILREVQQYLQYSRSSGNIDPTLESDMVNVTESLIKYTKLFNENRKGDDDITKITPTIIRQHVYSALSHRGLSNEHPLIKEIADKLLNEMNKYRQVVDKETNDELNDQAIQITRKVIDIFCFRLKMQAFEPTFQFFDAGQAVDSRFMQGAFGRDEIKKLEVEACGFPCIGIFDGDKSAQKVYTKAQIIARPKSNDTRYIVYSMK
ncbi:hypothetical protein RclHR1_07930003 [Rhizophagus clarus]|uniref:Uncharacterized protein n=1 Tax=Rhizophagus clarus TaxID=94130 RepID=A0A2Z6RZ00_9GLOM|nr:hypothetical protein RclHR1_07930003 [Rhizophagus clarus]